jgi:hypothetical protein
MIAPTLNRLDHEEVDTGAAPAFKILTSIVTIDL